MSAKNIVWLASYPKSGNTWTRAFLVNYIVNADKPVPINEMHRFSMGDALARTYVMVNKGPLNGLSEPAILKLRGAVLRGIAGNGADINLVKTHNVNDRAMGVTLIPAEFTRMAVYIIRNPLDVVLSYARHFGLSVDKTVYTIAQQMNTTARDDKNVKQFLGTWSRHVESWVRTKAFPVHVMRYEDMLADPETAFGALVQKIGMPADPDRLAKAIEFSSFKELKRQETEYGFIERSASSETFFHTGTADQWKEALTPDQVAKVRADHGKVMRRYGYF